MNHMHTQLHDPLQLRRDILESALESARAINATDSLKTLERDMSMFRKELKTVMKTLKASAAKLSQSLPPLPEEFHEQDKRIPPRAEAAPLPQPKLSRFTPTATQNTFERDLEEIRQKIKALER